MNVTTLRTDARYHIDPNLTSTDFADTDLDRGLNRWYRTVLAWAIKAQGDWQMNGDIMTTDLVSGQTDYAVPSNIISIFKAEIMYDSTTGFVPLTTIDVQRNTDSVEGNTTRTFDDVTRPTIEVFGNFLQIRPAPTTTVVNGLKIWAQTDFVDLDATTNNVPDLMECVHRILSYGAAYDFAMSRQLYAKAAEIKRNIFGDKRIDPDDNGLKGVLEDMYSIKNSTRRDRVTAARPVSYR